MCKLITSSNRSSSHCDAPLHVPTFPIFTQPKPQRHKGRTTAVSMQLRTTLPTNKCKMQEAIQKNVTIYVSSNALGKYMIAAVPFDNVHEGCNVHGTHGNVKSPCRRSTLLS